MYCNLGRKENDALYLKHRAKMLRLHRINVSSSGKLSCSDETLFVEMDEKLGTGRMCEAFRGSIYSPNDQLRHGNPVVVKRIIKHHFENDAVYVDKVKKYLDSGRAYTRMYNENSRATSKVEGAFWDSNEGYYYVLQVFHPGVSYSQLKFQEKKLIKELELIKKVIENVRIYHNAQFDGKPAPQFIGDLKPENFFVPTNNEEDAQDIVYFDFDVFARDNEEDFFGVTSYDNRYRPYLHVATSDRARQENDVTSIVLMLYERLHGGKEKLPEVEISLPKRRFIFTDCNCVSEDINKKLKCIFEKGLKHQYRDCDELYQDISRLIKYIKQENELRNVVPEFSKTPIGRGDLIEEIDRLFSLKKQKHVYLYGMGGIGKTTVALQYAKRESFSRCFFVKFTKDIKTSVVENMKFFDYDESAESDSDSIYQTKVGFLRKYDDNTLLIIDDFYDTTKTLDELRETPEFEDLLSLDMRILFTTRYNLDKKEDSVWVDALPIDESKRLFYEEVEDSSLSEDIVQDLIYTVQRHPLMIKLVAKTKKFSTKSLEEILELIKKGQDTVPVKHDGGYISAEKRQEKSIIEHLVGLFNFSMLNAEEKRILCVLQNIPGERIGLDTFCDLLEWETTGADEIKRCCQKLIDKGWIDADGSGNVSMHSVIAKAAGMCLNECFDAGYILSNWIRERYNYENKSLDMLSFSIVRLLRSLNRRFEKSGIGTPLSVLAAHELQDNELVNQLMRSAYGGQKTITIMSGQGKKTNNCYIIAFDGKQVVDCSVISPKKKTKWKGQAVFCWSDPENNDATDFVFNSMIEYHSETENEVDFIEITTIADHCFANSRTLTDIHLSFGKNETGKVVGVREIGKGAFENSNVQNFICDADELTVLEDRVFYGCTQLKSAFFPFSRISKIRKEAFAFNWDLSKFVCDIINANQDMEIEVGERAFWQCFNLKSFMSEGMGVVRLLKIENQAFYGCENLDARFSTDAERIGDSAFERCKRLEDITLKCGVKQIGEKAFCGCESVKAISFPESLEVIAKEAFKNTDLRNISISGNIKRIAKDAFDVLDSLQRFCVKSSCGRNAKIEPIGGRITEWVSLENVDLSNGNFYVLENSRIEVEGSVTVERTEAKDSLKSLGEAFLESVDNIGELRLSRHVLLKKGVQGIRVKYKRRQSSDLDFFLNALHMGVSKPLLLWWWFKWHAVLVGTFGLLLLCLWFKWYALLGTIIILYIVVCLISEVTDSKQYRKFIEGRLLKKKMNSRNKRDVIQKGDFEIKNFLFTMEDQKIELPKAVKNIGEHTFSATGILEIEGKGVSEIGNDAFCCCRELQTVSFPKLQVIKRRAFLGCRALEQIDLPNIEEIGECAFEAASLKKVSLPTFLNCIERDAFVGNPLTEVVIQNGNTKICDGAFRECEYLERINWENIVSLGQGAFLGCGFRKINLNVSIIPRKAFAKNRNLEEVEFLQKKVILEAEAFGNDYRLQQISSRWIDSVGAYALAGTAVTQLWFEDLYQIDEGAFFGCNLLRSVFIKCTSDLLRVGKEVFGGCLSLEQVWIDCDGSVDIDIEAFSEDSYAVYVLEGSAIERWAKQNSLKMVISVEREVMKQKWEEVSRK